MQLSTDKLNLNRSIHITLTEQDHKGDCLSLLVEKVYDIVNTHPSPYNLFVSGGVDSQAMVYAWKKSGVSFNVIHVNYMGYNSHDFTEIEQFCIRENIKLTTAKFDVVEFLETRMRMYATKFQCASPQICTYMAMSEIVDGTVVFSGNLPNINTLSLDNTIYGLQRYATLSRRSVIPFFLMSDEAASLASLAQSELVSHGVLTYDMKCEHYERLGFPIIRQSAKQTGFEHIKNLYDGQLDRVTPYMKMKHAHLPSNRVFDQLFRNGYLLEFKNHYQIKILVDHKF